MGLHTCVLLHAAYKLLVFLTCAAFTHVFCYMLHTSCLHTCKLLVFLTCAACTHVFCYSAAYMLLTHMQATSISHMWACIHVYYYVQYTIYAAALCSWVANLVLSSFILSSYRVSFGQLGRDSLRDKEIELCTDEFLGHTEKLVPAPSVPHEVCSLHACILCAVVHTPHTCSCL